MLAKFQQKYRDPTAGLQSKLQILSKRLSKMFTNQPIHIIYLPLAIPIVITSVVLVLIGYVITLFHPHYLLKVYNQILGEFEVA